MSRNVASDYYSPWPFASSKSYSYYSVGSSKVDMFRSRITDEDSSIFAVTLISLDSKYTEVERVVYTFGDLLGQIGGMQSTLSLIVMFLIAGYSNRSYISELIFSFYYVATELYEYQRVNYNNRSNVSKQYTKSQRGLIYEVDNDFNPVSIKMPEEIKYNNNEIVFSPRKHNINNRTETSINFYQPTGIDRDYDFELKELIKSKINTLKRF